MKPAGLEASKGVISVSYGKDPLDPTWKDDAGMKKYFDVHGEVLSRTATR